jgi:dipeptidyl aminopeptidase
VATKLITFLEIPNSYFRAASPTSIERNIYSVRVPIDAHSAAVERPNAVTDTSVPSYYSASFSPNAGFYLLSYEGPGVPYQKLIKTGDESGSRITNFSLSGSPIQIV